MGLGLGTTCAGFPSYLGFLVGGQSYSNFLASIDSTVVVPARDYRGALGLMRVPRLL